VLVVCPFSCFHVLCCVHFGCVVFLLCQARLASALVAIAGVVALVAATNPAGVAYLAGTWMFTLLVTHCAGVYVCVAAMPVGVGMLLGGCSTA
jgi:hypothetical protein